MKKYSAFIAAMVLAIFVLGPIDTLRAAGGADAQPPVEITKEEAAKKYPPDKGKTAYPEGVATATTTGGFFQSPYSSKVYDCRKTKKGAYLLDKSVNKVFLRP